MLGNNTTTINTTIGDNSNITININSNSSSVNSGQEIPPPEEPTAEATATNPLESPPDTVELVIGTWNIQNGRNKRLETALQALGVVGVDIGFLQETKLTDGIYRRFSLDYHVLATNAVSRTQGGVALVYRALPFWQVESAVLHRPNVISAEIISGKMKYSIVGAYVPPTVHIAATLDRFSRRRNVILVGDLNIELNAPESERDIGIAQLLADASLCNMYHHFKSGQQCSLTWHQKHRGEVVWSRACSGRI
jgi:hypothetical protein